MPRTTRTLNPLHFEDLEPHRFEDLVRQLAYDFRQWRRIEATGRGGGDEGMDIRALEAVLGADVSGDEEAEGNDDVERSASRLWVIQCKRERRLGPTDLRRIVHEAVPAAETGNVYGLIVAAACDLSRRARDAALSAARAAEVQEVIFWSNAELEDLLFQPKNDHLLFAYFGISLQVRRRSIKTDLRGLLATKRKAIRHLGDVQSVTPKTVLIRNVLDESYPQIADPAVFIARPQWKFYEFVGHQYPDHLVFRVHQYLALCDYETKEWDIFEGQDVARIWEQIAFLPEEEHGYSEEYSKARAYWSAKPDNEKGWFTRQGLIRYDEILAIDEHGDAFHAVPHILVEFNDSTGPFTWMRNIVESDSAYRRRGFRAKHEGRRELFPAPLPDLPPTDLETLPPPVL